MHYATTGRLQPEHRRRLTLVDGGQGHAAATTAVFGAVGLGAKDKEKEIIEQEIIGRGTTTLNCQALLGEQNITAKDVAIVSQADKIVALVGWSKWKEVTRKKEREKRKPLVRPLGAERKKHAQKSKTRG